MNPRSGQYRLGSTVHEWTRLDPPTARQGRLLRRSYQGLNPWVYSRYGRRQWAAPLPWVRVVVKDPFAMLSLPAIVSHTGALPVLVYRHPGAVLVSFRRMGWTPAITEVVRLEALVRTSHGSAAVPALAPETPMDLLQVARMWSVLHDIALADARVIEDVVVVSHEELAGGGPLAVDRLHSRCGLQRREAPASSVRETRTVNERRLHNLDRNPCRVAGAWRTQIPPRELSELERLTRVTMDALETQRLRVTSATD